MSATAVAERPTGPPSARPSSPSSPAPLPGRRRGALGRALLGAVGAGAVVLGLGLLLARTGAGGAAGDEVLGPGPVTVELGIEHSRFSLDEVHVRAGSEVRFVVSNGDPILHELITGPDEVHARHEAGTEAVHPPRPGEVTVEPLRTAETTYAFDEPGEYLFACHLPGHLAYGMVGTVVVEPA